MGHQVAAVQHPGPIDAIANLCREPTDILIPLKIGATGQDATEQQRRIDAGKLAIPMPLAVSPIDEMIKESVLLVHLTCKEVQRGMGALARLCVG